MEWQYIVLIVVAVILVLAAVLYFVGRNLQKKSDSQQVMMEQHKMVTSILVIDKKKMRMKESNLPKMVQDQIPAYLKWRKLPLVKAKIGPKITTLLCDDRVFKELPIKKMVKVDLAGMYIMGIKGSTGKNTTGKTKSSGKNGQKRSLKERASQWLAQSKAKKN